MKKRTMSFPARTLDTLLIAENTKGRSTIHMKRKNENSPTFGPRGEDCTPLPVLRAVQEVREEPKTSYDTQMKAMAQKSKARH